MPVVIEVPLGAIEIVVGEDTKAESLTGGRTGRFA